VFEEEEQQHCFFIHDTFALGGILYMVRNKERGFPNQNNNKFEGEPKAKAEYNSLRADGTINTHPQERMRASGRRQDHF
jgi:small acid-soluble spore protein K (minor)